MRIILFNFLLGLSFFCYSQDSLQNDSNHNEITSLRQDSINTVIDSETSNESVIIPKTKGKEKQKREKKKYHNGREEDKVNIGVDVGINKIFIILGLSIFLLLIFRLVRSILYKINHHSPAEAKNNEFISDYVSRKILSRRDYYRNVYLKSEEWQRKRYVVLKRDNWKCVYCGDQATQVHHTRYAKWNIGKEPIEWLVSICKPCHEAKH